MVLPGESGLKRNLVLHRKLAEFYHLNSRFLLEMKMKLREYELLHNA
jgi:hypothetical protein